MGTAGKRLGLVGSVISLGVLLYSPLCSLNCATSDCSLAQKTKVAEHSEKTGHCHHGQDSQQPAESTSSIPKPPSDSGHCPVHADAMALLSSSVKAPGLHQSAQPVVAVLPEALNLPFDASAAKAADGRPFRSPPKRAVISVYRI